MYHSFRTILFIFDNHPLQVLQQIHSPLKQNHACIPGVSMVKCWNRYVYRPIQTVRSLCSNYSLTCVQCTAVLVLQPELSEHKTLNKSICTTRTPVHSALVKHYLSIRCLAIKAICQNKNIWSENRRRISDLESLRQCLFCILKCDPPLHRHERLICSPTI